MTIQPNVEVAKVEVRDGREGLCLPRHGHGLDGRKPGAAILLAAGRLAEVERSTWTQSGFMATRSMASRSTTISRPTRAESMPLATF